MSRKPTDRRDGASVDGARARSLLEKIDGPQDLRGLSEQELAQLAQEVRAHIIDTVGEIGGHFGANLGTCELAVALHSLLESPRDKILWDVGHQAYPHKILTGRRDRLATIRQYGGLAPFCSRAESPHDIMGAGHASTSIGYAVGIKEGMRLRAGETGAQAADAKVVAVIGDGAMTGGVAFEAIGQAGGLGTPIVVVLNDNGMSIAPNVGALSRYFNRVRLNPKLWRARADIEGGLTRLPIGIGAAFERLGPHLKESIKAFWAPGLWWEELDWAYMGVIDGHDVRALREALREALAAQRPVVVHIATVKGKGFAPAEQGGLEGMEQWHAAKPNSITNGVPTKTPAAPARAAKRNGARAKLAPAPAPQYTQVFGEALLRECRRDERVVGITAAMNSGTGLSILQKAMPERYFDVGIAEQQAILFAAGLALQGVKPVAAIYSTFLQRAYDQVVHDVCLQRLNVVFAMDRAGLVGDDGPTHHGAFDIAYLRCLPNIVLMAPRDEAMLVNMLHTALLYDDGPIALRYPRGEGTGAPLPLTPRAITIGTGEILREASPAVAASAGPGAAGPGAAGEHAAGEHAAGRRVALIGYGSGVGKALAAAEQLAGLGIAVTVADARFAKPIDAGLMAQLAAEHDLLVTVEEGVLAGGFGSAVWETLNDAGVAGAAGAVRIMRIGLPDEYVTHGKPALLHEQIGFTSERIVERVAAAVGARRSGRITGGGQSRPAGSAIVGA
ncbi:MAG TPA: 1-deoxy-D-xylulose-5-phosphate synthase [Solirubrobacteraceae bacterium]|nr:1-deoxy-D-xylulose-5-phosphate synthase [Solirubrobacteraceae bacterium]